MTALNLKRLIHVGCRELGIDNDTRRELQLIATGKASMSEMTDDELLAMVEALKTRGFKPYGKTYFTSRKDGSKRAGYAPASRPDLRFVHVLWKKLGDAGALTRPDRGGLNAFIRSRFENKWRSVPIDVDALRDAGQINDVIRALKEMCARNRIDIK